MAAVAESSEQPRRSKIGEARKRNVEESRTRCRQEREEKDKDKQDGGAWDQHAPRFLAHLSQARLRIYGQWELCISRRPHVKRPKKGTGLSGLALVSCCSPETRYEKGVALLCCCFLADLTRVRSSGVCGLVYGDRFLEFWRTSRVPVPGIQFSVQSSSVSSPVWCLVWCPVQCPV